MSHELNMFKDFSDYSIHTIIASDTEEGGKKIVCVTYPLFREIRFKVYQGKDFIDAYDALFDAVQKYNSL